MFSQYLDSRNFQLLLRRAKIITRLIWIVEAKGTKQNIFQCNANFKELSLHLKYEQII